MQTFTQNITDLNIIEAVCRARIKLAEQRHQEQYVGRLVGSIRQRQDDEEGLGQLLPPRKQWSRYRPPQRRSIPDVDLVSLVSATLSLWQSEPQPAWAIRLKAFIQRIHDRVLNSDSFEFTKPQISWELKNNNEYRAIGMFNLEDNVICSLVAKYLTNFIDIALDDASHAFRAAGKNGKTPTYHAAFDRIYETRQAASGKRLYVAECDIRGFYDSVDHGVAWKAFQRVVAEVERLHPTRKLDPRAATIFKAYLDCYSFPQNVLGEALERLKAEKGQSATFPWPAKELGDHHTDLMSARIGVPQGGAISCIIANLVLDLADKRMKGFPGIKYLRYCDDMVLIAPTQKECRLAFQEYLDALDKLKLPYHPPIKVKTYGKEFWSSKSKAPYCWSAKTRPSYVPWVQFVGYQIRYDGWVRVKPKSVQKQMTAMTELVDKVKWGLLRVSRPFPRPGEPRPILATQSQAENSLISKLTSMGVGRVNPENPTYAPLPMCWCSGFKALQGKPIVPTFLKQLDRERERQIRRFKRAGIVYGFGRPIKPSNHWHNPKGYLFSYHAQFTSGSGDTTAP